MALRSWPLLALALLVACGGGEPGSPDAALPDAGGPDGGADAGSLPDAGPTPDAGVPDAGQDAGLPTDAGLPSDGGVPITAPSKVWTWVDVPDSKCAAGTPTGLGVNLNPASTDVLIFLEGGGACTSGTSCWGPSPSAYNLNGFTQLTFALVMKKPSPLFDRTNGGNPFRDLNYVFVPYCTGDMHAGTKEVALPVDGGTKATYFWGARDLRLFLGRLAATFPHAQRVYLAGASAGGFGTVLTFDLVRSAFGDVRVDIIDDSGPSITPKGGGSGNGALGLWGFQAPAGCSPCESHRDVLAYDRATQPGSRYALLTYAQDSVIAPDFGYTLAEYPAVIDSLVTTFAPDPNMAAFIVSGVQDHVVNGDTAEVPVYMPWLTQMVGDDAGWTTARVTHP